MPDRKILMPLVVSVVAVAQALAAPTGKSGDVDGKKIFTAKCVICHGKDAKGSPAMAKLHKVKPEALDLTSEATQKKNDADLIKVMTTGRGKMPSFKGKLKDEEVAGVIGYVRSISKSAPAKETSETPGPVSPASAK